MSKSKRDLLDKLTNSFAVSVFDVKSILEITLHDAKKQLFTFIYSSDLKERKF